MSHGFLINDSTGANVVNSSNYGFSIIDIFEVSPSSSGSRTYPDISDINVLVVQTQTEPTTTSKPIMLSFNSVNVSVSNSGTNKVVSWSPGITRGNVYNVVLYVMGV